jgi:pSer/pThr/pTyr-binding forkhead associated (FHA) protein
VPDPRPATFLEACGSIGPLRLSLKGLRATPSECRAFEQPFAVIGRAPGADLDLDHPGVSRRHTYLQLIEGRLFGVDLSSRTGTHWQDVARPMGWLGRGHSLRIGPYRVGRWGEESPPETDEAEPPSPVSRAFEPPGLVEGILEFLDPSVEPTTWPISQVLVLLGRSPACKIQLSGSNVSKLHCSLVRTAQGVWAVDLLGRGGILVNGTATRAARLDDGDVLQIGPHRIRLWYARAPQHPARPDVPASWPTNGRASLPQPVEPSQLLALRDPAAEALLMPLVRELGQMQQQMADQFQQALMMMFEMFSGMHQEQMTLVREQLAELSRLSQEQASLQDALTARARETPARPAAGRVPPVPYRRDRDRPAAAPAPAARAPSSQPMPRPEAARTDVHSALVERLAAIQDERESRWQKLIRSILGGER